MLYMHNILITAKLLDEIQDTCSMLTKKLYSNNNSSMLTCSRCCPVNDNVFVLIIILKLSYLL